MTAVVNAAEQATLLYLSQSKDWQGTSWRPATKEEFLRGYSFDDLVGAEGDAIDADDSIFCVDGVVKGSEIL
jgi:hypothetical protein